MLHIIKKQVIDLQLENETNAFRIQHLIGEHYHNGIVPVLEAVFNECCGEDEVLILDRLEIDLGNIPEEDLEKSRWDDALLAALRSGLRENILSLSINKKTIRRSLAMNSCLQWISYMQTGHLPWNTLRLNEAWYQAVLETLATDYTGITTLRTLIANETRFVHRIILQHDVSFLSKLVEILTAQSQRQLAVAIEEIYILVQQLTGTDNQSAPSRSVFIPSLWQQVLLLAAAGGNTLTTETIAGHILGSYMPLLPIRKKNREKLFSALPVLDKVLPNLFQRKNTVAKILPVEDSSPIQKTLAAADPAVKQPSPEKEPGMEFTKGIDSAIPEGKAGKPANDNKTAPVSSSLDKERSQENNMNTAAPAISEEEPQKDSPPVSGTLNRKEERLPETSPDRPKDHDRSQQLNKTIPAEGIFIQNAGILLTHPFLGFLFRRLGWMENNRFVSAEARVKAIFILHYLATGLTTASEHELVLCKLLCVYPLDEPLPVEMVFTDAELAEATDMLTALIQQWTKLQNTSIAGLREGFLQRSGRLLLYNATPLVQVEHSAIDILLDFLPWNLSLIKLPWMNETVRAEWR